MDLVYLFKEKRYLICSQNKIQSCYIQKADLNKVTYRGVFLREDQRYNRHIETVRK